ncbi:MAG: hypothetical protein V3W41_13505 [Planctomycetota bacterium]
MSPKEKRAAPSNKRWLLILFAVMLPALPALWTRFLQDKERAAIPSPSALEADARARLAALPAPTGDPRPILYEFQPGQSFIAETRFRRVISETSPGRSPSSDPIDLEFEAALAKQGGRFRFEIASLVLPGPESRKAWKVRVQRLSITAAEAKLEFHWHRDGSMTWIAPTPEPGPRQFFIENWGLFFPGPLRSPARRFDQISNLRSGLSFSAKQVMKRLEIEIGADSIPPEGGVFLRERPEGKKAAGAYAFTWIGYSRRAASGREWGGGLEILINGEFETTGPRLELCQGTWRVQESFELRRSDETKAWADHSIEIQQTIKPE